MTAALGPARHLTDDEAVRLGTDIQRRIGVKTSRNEPLARFTTMRVGGPADLFAEMFEPRFRYSGASFSYAMGAVLGGGFAPLIAAWLQASTGTSLAVSAYMVAVGLVSLVAVYAIREPSRVSR